MGCGCKKNKVAGAKTQGCKGPNCPKVTTTNKPKVTGSSTVKR